MKGKGTRRQEAMKKNKRQLRIIAAICALVIAAVVAFIVIQQIQQNARERENRVFALGGSSVTLRPDGTFNALMPHGVERNGTFGENRDDEISTVSFTQGDRTVFGSIVGDVLVIPPEWDDGCGHGTAFTLRP